MKSRLLINLLTLFCLTPILVACSLADAYNARGLKADMDKLFLRHGLEGVELTAEMVPGSRNGFVRGTLSTGSVELLVRTLGLTEVAGNNEDVRLMRSDELELADGELFRRWRSGQDVRLFQILGRPAVLRDGVGHFEFLALLYDPASGRFVIHTGYSYG